MTTSSVIRAERTRTAFYGMAVCDALGGPLEFRPRRKNPKDYLRDMIPNPNFRIPAGHFTDDTSMALCLATSLSTSKGLPDPVDQAARYVDWCDNGYMSSIPGPAFDVGIQTTEVLDYWRTAPSKKTLTKVGADFKDERRCGNGSLMRVLPCGLVASSEEHARLLATESSQVTHPHQRCVDACVIHSTLVFQALNGATKDQLFQTLRNLVADPALDNELAQRFKPYTEVEDFSSKPRNEISSSGYVLHSLEAALWGFFSTDSFEDGAIEVVNLGNDADTIGAIYGGLAGAFYGKMECIPQRWLAEMKEMELVDTAVTGILEVVIVS